MQAISISVFLFLAAFLSGCKSELRIGKNMAALEINANSTSKIPEVSQRFDSPIPNPQLPPPNTVAAPKSSLTSQIFTEVQTVIFTSSTPDVSIHCTTNGSEPDANSPTCNGAITIVKETEFKVLAIKNNWINSEISTFKYQVIPELKDPYPATGNGTGAQAYLLPNGNYVVRRPTADVDGVVDVGTVSLYNGEDYSIIDTLSGGTENDRIGH